MVVAGPDAHVHVHGIVYHIAENFYWIKILPSLAPCITEIFGRINFHQCWIKILLMRAGGEIGENFLPAQVYGYMVYTLYIL